MPLNLRTYQQTAVTALRNTFRTIKSVLLVLPTGGG